MEINEKKKTNVFCVNLPRWGSALSWPLYLLSPYEQKKLNINCKRYNLGGFVQLSFKPHVKIR